jgi:hypothetical protein
MHVKFKIFFCCIFTFLAVTPIDALSSSNNETNKSNVKQDLAIISGERFTLIINNENYDIYYGIVLGESSQLDYTGKITSMSIIPEKKSLMINFANILQTDNVWIRFPNKVISAENEKFSLIVDGIQKGYELSAHGDETRLGFIIGKDTHQVEIIGNNVIPEFSSNALLLFLFIFCTLVILPRIKLKIP